ncbi:uncharacterized protein si:ch211-136m16.8 [Lampris incognitus]|uniref:uncharacterized protein si:ch211-136m16.8 n=1 Tax=Lampris incognitus TaxID=2546036 RepID=UPI0024B5D17C|nr:uncharacterized protein si:ch211-136m16.8 [Lampris incognitus]
MDAPDPFTRLERTFRVVWNYITDAVGRLLRPETANAPDNSGSDSRDGEKGSLRAVGDAREPGDEEERGSPTTAPGDASSRSAAAWDAGQEDVQFPLQVNRGHGCIASEEGGGKRDRSGGPLTTEGEVEQGSDGKLKLHGRSWSVTQGSDERQDLGNNGDPLLLQCAVEENIKDICKERDKAATSLVQEGRNKSPFQVEDEEAAEYFKDPNDVSSLGTEERNNKLCMEADLSIGEGSGQCSVSEGWEREEDGEAGVTYEVAVMEGMKRSDSVSQHADLNLLTSENGSDSDERRMGPGLREVHDTPPVSEKSEEGRKVETDPQVTAAGPEPCFEPQIARYETELLSNDERTVVGKEEMMMRQNIERSEPNEVQNQREMEDGTTAVDKEQDSTTEEENLSKKEITTNKVSAEETWQEDGSEAVTEDGKEEGHNREVLIKNAETGAQRARLEDGDKHDEPEVVEIATKTRNEDAVEIKSPEVSGISGNLLYETMLDNESKAAGTIAPTGEKLADAEKGCIEEERVLSEQVRTVLMPLAVEIKPNGNNGEETSGELNISSPGTSGEPVVFPEKLTSTVCGANQEGVPGVYNGHWQEDDGTQRMTGGGDSTQNQTTQLPEGPGNFRNIAGSTEGDHILVTEHEIDRLDSQLKSSGGIVTDFDMVVKGQSEIWHLIDAELPRNTERPPAEPMNVEAAQLSRQAAVEEAGPVIASLEMAARQPSEGYRAEKEPSVMAEKILVEPLLAVELSRSTVAAPGDGVRTGDGVCSASGIEEDEPRLTGDVVKLSETKFEKITGTRFLNESEDVVVSERSHGLATNSPTDGDETEGLELSAPTWQTSGEDQNVEPHDSAKVIPDWKLNLKEVTESEEEEKAVENEWRNRADEEDWRLSTLGETAGLFKKQGREMPLTGGFKIADNSNTELSGSAKTNLSDMSPDVNHGKTMMTVTKLPEDTMKFESKPEDTVVMSAEEEKTADRQTAKVTEIAERNDEETDPTVTGLSSETDEEILEMWTKAVLSEDNDDEDEATTLIQTRKREAMKKPGAQTAAELLPSNVEPDQELSAQTDEDEPLRSRLVSGAKMTTSSTSESGFSDWSQIGQMAPENETHLLTSDYAGKPPDTAEMGEMFVSELSTMQSEVTEGKAEPEQLHVEEDQPSRTLAVQKIRQVETRAVLSEEQCNNLPNEPQENRGTENTESVEVKVTDPDVPESKPGKKPGRVDAEGKEANSRAEIDSVFVRGEPVKHGDGPREKVVRIIPDGMEENDLGPVNERVETDSFPPGERGESEAHLGERLVGRESGGHACLNFQEKLREVRVLDEAHPERSKVTSGWNAGDRAKLNASVLDFTAQKSRIAVKNPSARPPKDPRSLLHKPSVDPTPPKPSGKLPAKGLTGVPLGGVGIGIKLPGLGAGPPVLKKTQKVLRDQTKAESSSQEAEAGDESAESEEMEHKPKWIPPNQPGFGNPFMSELKNKLNKPTED